MSHQQEHHSQHQRCDQEAYQRKPGYVRPDLLELVHGIGDDGDAAVIDRLDDDGNDDVLGGEVNEIDEPAGHGALIAGIALAGAGTAGSLLLMTLTSTCRSLPRLS